MEFNGPFLFTCMHLVDTFIQSNLEGNLAIQAIHLFFHIWFTEAEVVKVR